MNSLISCDVRFAASSSFRPAIQIKRSNNARSSRSANLASSVGTSRFCQMIQAQQIRFPISRELSQFLQLVETDALAAGQNQVTANANE